MGFAGDWQSELEEASYSRLDRLSMGFLFTDTGVCPKQVEDAPWNASQCHHDTNEHGNRESPL